ncbi:MAG: hypothetical protein BGO47_11405 [Microbacterium sp. 67-17]|uniref:protein kinase domain-containing protein n=1 Tax=Microbacterium sp. 67-17 TaxID=1895782 RepID=UPI000967643F|nr:PASTA domain-containing protein [Microbacterium sp. 67-17]OJW02325.1 MAG: hypothetical protein BGO47_11405 [Microbacterium sp. 67-17]
MAAVISGRFRIIELLGTGGSASVFLADDAQSRQRVALKILHPHLTGRAAARAFFLEEAARASRLQHPHSARVLDVGEDLDRPEPVVWIALEVVAGATVAEHIRATGPLMPSVAARLLMPVLEALDAAHSVGLVHRDVSPTNVMVARDNEGQLDPDSVRLLDFGIAGDAGETAVGADALLASHDEGRVGVLGNASYMSPEQARGDAVDARGDIYQAGALLYFALVGQAPFRREEPAQVARAHLEAPPPVPSVQRPGVPRALDRIVVKAMLKDPDDRFADARTMRDALVDAISGNPSPSGVEPSHPNAAMAPTAVPPLSQVRAEGLHALSGELDVTRVLGTTVTPSRAPASSAASPFHAVRRGRRPAGIVMIGTISAAVALGVAVSLAASPSASITADPTASPTSPAATPSPTPSAESTGVDDRPHVPDVSQTQLAEASARIVDAGLVVGTVSTVDSRWPEGTVLGTSPASGERAAFGSSVAVTVASGYNAVPSVTAMDVQLALSMITEAGFSTASVPTSTLGSGVIGTDPSGGSRWAVGSTVTVFEPAPALSPTPSPSPTPEPASSPTPTRTPTPPVVP